MQDPNEPTAGAASAAPVVPTSAKLVPVMVGAVVAVTAGTYARLHDPTGQATISLFFSSTLAFKAWTTSLVAALATFQLGSALRLYGKIPWPRRTPSWLGEAHRLSGTLTVAFSLPVAYHCLWSIGFDPDLSAPRPLVHSVAGLFFYGALAAKVIIVRDHRLPGWMLPVFGGAVFTSLIVVWLTSSLWFFTAVGGV